MLGIIKAVKEFLSPESYSTQRAVKKIKGNIVKTKELILNVENISDKDANLLAYFFQDKEVNKITNFIKGSDIVPLIR